MPNLEKVAQPQLGNLLDHWDGMANDTKDLLKETETGFFNAVESLRSLADPATGRKP
jgi:ABC-type transporter Mla subunit MlaD